MNLVGTIAIQIMEIYLKTSNKGEEVFMRKHGCFGPTRSSTCVAEGEALIRIHFNWLLVDNTLEVCRFKHFPKIVNFEFARQLLFEVSINRVTKDDILEIGCIVDWEQFFCVAGAADAGADIGVFQAVSQVVKSQSIIEWYWSYSIQNTGQIGKIELLPVSRVNSYQIQTILFLLNQLLVDQGRS